jgi:hypothetical protein
MGRPPVSFRLSEEALFVIDQYKDKQGLPDRTSALESMVRNFWKIYNKPSQKIRRFFRPATETKPLEAFLSA